MSDFSCADLERAFRAVGMGEGDVVFSMSNIGFFGVPEGGLTRENLFGTVLSAFQGVLGASGTLVVPTFTYSFCRGEDFDPASSPTANGLFPEMLRRAPGSRRSHDPLFSVAALGARAEALTADAPVICFGPGSVWERLIDADALVCNLNHHMAPPLITYLERELGETYRRDRRFTGALLTGGERLQREALYYSRDLADAGAQSYVEPLQALAESRGLCRIAMAGRGRVLGMRARAFRPLIEEALRANPHFLIRAGHPA